MTLPRFRSLDRDLHVDVAIVGGGITGITAAYLLTKAGKSVALIERHRCLQADTGRTTAHLTCVTDTRLSALAKSFGVDHARATWDAGLAAIAQIDGIVRTEAIECGFAWVPGYLHAPHAPPAQPAGNGEQEAEMLRAEANQIAELGFDARYLNRVPFMNVPGIEIDGQARFNPRRYLAALLDRIHAGSGYVFEQTNVDDITTAGGDTAHDAHNAPLSVIAGYHPHHLRLRHRRHSQSHRRPRRRHYRRRCCRRSWRCIRPMPSADAWLPDRFPTRCSGILPIPTTICASTETRTAIVASDDVVIYGGADHKTGQAGDTRECVRADRDGPEAARPGVAITHRWSGQVIETNDGLPFIGEMAPRQFAATGFSGNGMTFGTLAAMMACDAALGRSIRGASCSTSAAPRSAADCGTTSRRTRTIRTT